MLSLHYIIIGDLPKGQKEYLEQNIREDKADLENIEVVFEVWDGNRQSGAISAEHCTNTEVGIREWLQHFLPEESIFISGDYRQLQAAVEYGMATLGYLKEDICVREHNEECNENSENRIRRMCPNTDMWAEGFEEIDLKFLKHVYERHHGIPWTILTTERCVIKEFSMDYLDDLFELYAGEGMTDYIEPLYPYEQEKEYQEAYIKHMYGFYGYGMWIVCDKKTGKLIGRAGVEHREELEGEMELGYAIGVPYQRQGYATEVCTAILKYAKEELLQTSVCCLIEEGNDISEQFAKKLGFFCEGTIVIGERRMKKYVYVF